MKNCILVVAVLVCLANSQQKPHLGNPEYKQDEAALASFLSADVLESIIDYNPWQCTFCNTLGLATNDYYTYLLPVSGVPGQYQVKSFVGYYSSKKMFWIAYRGLDGLQTLDSPRPEEKNNFKNAILYPNTTSYPDPSCNCQVNAQLFQDYQKYTAIILYHIRMLINQKRIRDDFNFIVTGFGPGGSSAQFLALELARQYRSSFVKVYTYGSFAIGDQAFVNHYNSRPNLKDKVFRHVNNVDQAPHRPKDTQGYRQVGDQIWFQPNKPTQYCHYGSITEKCSTTLLPGQLNWFDHDVTKYEQYFLLNEKTKKEKSQQGKDTDL